MKKTLFEQKKEKSTQGIKFSKIGKSFLKFDYKF